MWLPCLVSLSLALLFGGCGGGSQATPDGGALDSGAPDGGGGGLGVIATTPIDDAAGVAFNAEVTATLDQNVDPTSVQPASLSVTDGTTAVSGTVTVSGSTVTFRPDVGFQADVTYVATLDATVADLAGDTLGTSFTWQFTTADYNVAFVTSVSGTADLSSWTDAGGETGLAAADAVCRARATAAGLGSAADFRAWMSDSNDDAYCRIQNLTGKRADNCGQATLPALAGPWVRVDGYPFAGPLSELFGTGNVYTPVRFDELGNEVDASYFTGTRGVDGTVAIVPLGPPTGDVPATCADWTSNANDPTLHGTGGDPNLTDRFWSSGFSATCGLATRLLCMRTGVGAPLPAFGSDGKKVFVTSVHGTADLSTWADAGANTGVAAGDAICRARASAAGLANAASFKAWLSDASNDARDRISSDGPWVRLDGVPVARNKADLLDGSVFTSISVDENGTHTGSFPVLTGTTTAGTEDASTCSDWTDETSGSMGNTGFPRAAGPSWTASTTHSCSYALFRLYCFED